MPAGLPERQKNPETPGTDDGSTGGTDVKLDPGKAAGSETEDVIFTTKVLVLDTKNITDAWG
eukprot:8584530-Alexandrium_andersonii.AAC.1